MEGVSQYQSLCWQIVRELLPEAFVQFPEVVPREIDDVDALQTGGVHGDGLEEVLREVQGGETRERTSQGIRY